MQVLHTSQWLCDAVCTSFMPQVSVLSSSIYTLPRPSVERQREHQRMPNDVYTPSHNPVSD